MFCGVLEQPVIIIMSIQPRDFGRLRCRSTLRKCEMLGMEVGRPLTLLSPNFHPGNKISFVPPVSGILQFGTKTTKNPCCQWAWFCGMKFFTGGLYSCNRRNHECYIYIDINTHVDKLLLQLNRYSYITYLLCHFYPSAKIDEKMMMGAWHEQE